MEKNISQKSNPNTALNALVASNPDGFVEYSKYLSTISQHDNDIIYRLSEGEDERIVLQEYGIDPDALKEELAGGLMATGAITSDFDPAAYVKESMATESEFSAQDASCMTEETSGEDPCYRDQTPDGKPLGTETVIDALLDAETIGIVEDPYYKPEDTTALLAEIDRIEAETEIVQNDTPKDINHEQYASLGMSVTSEGIMSETGEFIASNPEELGAMMWKNITPDAPETFTITEDPSVLDIDMSNAVAVPISNDTSQGHGLPEDASCVSDNPFQSCPKK